MTRSAVNCYVSSSQRLASQLRAAGESQVGRVPAVFYFVWNRVKQIRSWFIG